MEAKKRGCGRPIGAVAVRVNAIHHRFIPLEHLPINHRYVQGRAGHRSSDEHGGGNPRRKLLHGFRDGQSAEAMPDEDHLLVPRESRHELSQRLEVLGNGSDGVRLPEVDSGGGQVEGGDVVARGFEKWEEFEPGPGAMAGSVDEHKLFVKMRLRSIGQLEEERRQN